MTIDTVCTVQS